MGQRFGELAGQVSTKVGQLLDNTKSSVQSSQTPVQIRLRAKLPAGFAARPAANFVDAAIHDANICGDSIFKLDAGLKPCADTPGL